MCEHVQGRMCLPVSSIFPLSQMSDTRASAWQWMQMLPLTLWSPPPAEALHQHSALPGSGCRCCPYWRVQKFFLLPDCASLHWWCSGGCCVVTLSDTLLFMFVLLCYWSAAPSYYIFHLLFCYTLQSTFFFNVEWFPLFHSHTHGVFRLFRMFFLP